MKGLLSKVSPSGNILWTTTLNHAADADGQRAAGNRTVQQFGNTMNVVATSGNSIYSAERLQNETHACTMWGKFSSDGVFEKFIDEHCYALVSDVAQPADFYVYEMLAHNHKLITPCYAARHWDGTSYGQVDGIDIESFGPSWLRQIAI